MAEGGQRRRFLGYDEETWTKICPVLVYFVAREKRGREQGGEEGNDAGPKYCDAWLWPVE